MGFMPVDEACFIEIRSLAGRGRWISGSRLARCVVAGRGCEVGEGARVGRRMEQDGVDRV